MGEGVPSEDTEGPSELVSVPASPQLSLHLGTYRVRYALSTHPLPALGVIGYKGQFSGMAVTISVDKGWGLHPGVGTRNSEEVMISGPWVIAISGPRFSFTGGALCCAGS